MVEACNSFAVAVLAGGRSSRMGRDKALLPQGEGGIETFLSRAYHLACDLLVRCGSPDNQVVISGNYEDYPCIPDAFAGRGPVAGIHGALEHFRGQTDPRWILFLPVDMPALSVDSLVRLLDAADTASLFVHFDAHELPVLVRSSTESLDRVTALLTDTSLPKSLCSLRGLYATGAEQTVRFIVSSRRELVNVNDQKDYSNWIHRDK